jgi:DNA-binding IclR family transcriptional regulator
LSRKSPSAGRALQVLEILAIDPHRRHSLAELRRTLGSSQGTMHALLSTLERAGYVRRDPSDRLYSLGPAVLPIGDAARRAYPIVDRALGPMQELADELDTECHAGVRTSDEILVVARFGPAQPIGVGVQVGERYPLRPPLGAGYMAWAPADEIQEYLSRAAPDLTAAELDRHRQALEAVRRRGYSIHADDGPRQHMAEIVARHEADPESDEIDGTVKTLVGELGHYRYLLADVHDLVPGSLIELSAPVFDADGRVAITVGVSSVAPKVAATPVEEVAARVLATAAAITRSVGGRPPLTAVR